VAVLVVLTIVRQSRWDPGIGNSTIPDPGIENSSPGLQSLVLPLSCYRKKLQNLSHLICGLQICQIWIQLITVCAD